jgi:PelA/Pel-15E family pectate lyase
MRALAIAAFFTVSSAPAATIGTSLPAQSVTAERIAELPPPMQDAWKDYLARSRRQLRADRAALDAELKAAGLTESITPPGGPAARCLPLDRPGEWYGSTEARHLADIVISFQTPAGGWSKNLNLADHVRRPGEHYAPDNLSRYLSPGDFDTPHDREWSYVGTLDNDATTTELQFLARAIAASPANAAAYRASFLRGVEYLLAAQYPNGGWPQVWPLEGGYHDAITFNDGAMTEALDLLSGTAGGRGIFAFVPANVRQRAAAALDRGVECILAAQVVAQGNLAAWGQQHDALTLEPVAARNYEPAALCSSESAGVVLLLMRLEHTDARVRKSVDAAVAWLRQEAIRGETYTRGPESRLVPDRKAPLLWARYYAIDTGLPVFGDRDRSIHDTVEEISRERRMGYSWYGTAPQTAIDAYERWSASGRP